VQKKITFQDSFQGDMSCVKQHIRYVRQPVRYVKQPVSYVQQPVCICIPQFVVRSLYFSYVSRAFCWVGL
jgi:hypothetical protein